MPSALVSALAAPIREVQSLIGQGWPDDLGLSRLHMSLSDIASASRRTWTHTEQTWSGAGADAAAQFAVATVIATEELAARVQELSVVTQTAGGAVARANERLRDIVERFEARAAALEPYLGSPAAEREMLAEAQRTLAEAVAVVEELRAELQGHAATLSPSPAPSSPAATTPADMGSPSMPSMNPLPGVGGGSPSGGLGELTKFAAHDAPLPDAAVFGDGFAVRLPDGSTAMAPNTLAASAVRHALTQLGVPYEWGGTTPGVGLDCSGLTQWAYHEAGLDIPRLAQEQDIGAAVDAGSLRPGDLAVWDGHVAMIVGNGTMIEAGDPVQLSPIRTTNAGQGFQGFWRPTG
ncbi:NlpC/P60 family protein [Mycobacterium sp. NPDC048908]|uniref:NlpC/P60 family protein n=1 Tax=Mycobacterium sp. NPDC048908 TaxID=3364292 RepID=UPI003720FCC2